LQAVKQPAEILGPCPLDSCILGVGAEARAVDDFIETITRTSIFSGLSREDLARVATPLGQQLGVHPGVVLLVILLNLDVWFFPYQRDVYQIAYFGTGEQGFSHARGRRFMVAKLLVSLLAVAASVPWWRALGLIR
jgi:hypothetical protein